MNGLDSFCERCDGNLARLWRAGLPMVSGFFGTEEALRALRVSVVRLAIDGPVT